MLISASRHHRFTRSVRSTSVNASKATYRVMTD